METKGDLLLSLGWNCLFNAVVGIAISYQKEDLACAWVKV